MRHLIVGLALILMLAAAGCDSGSSVTSTSSGSISWSFDAADPGFPLVYPGPPVTYGTPVLEGSLHIDAESRCVTLAETPESVWVLAVPGGSTMDMTDSANPVLVMEGCVPMHDGDRVQFAGGREGSDHALDPSYLERCGATVEKPWLVGYCAGTSQR